MPSGPTPLAVAGRRPYASTAAVVGIGALAVVLAALPYKAFDLDRYFVPKELALHLTAMLGAIGALVAMGRMTGRGRGPAIPLTRVDTLLIVFLALSAASALLSQNEWLAARALAVSVSGVVLFWVSHALARMGWSRLLVALLAAAVTVAAVTSLMQAYGIETELFSLNRSPGGTLGNRNFVAHLAAVGIPALILIVLRARRLSGALLAALATAVVTAALVLSRSRAAWVATAVALLCVLPGAWRGWRALHGPMREPLGGRPLGQSRRERAQETMPSLVGRSTVVCLAALGGICAAVVIPNTLNWRSSSPYLDSVIGVANYREGSGHGRLVQYANSARLAVAHPLLGVGPGNWAVAYPRVAPRADPSLDADDGMTANPWPSSDWVAFVSERGAPAAVCLALALLGLVVTAARTANEAAADGRVDRLVPALALTATVVAIIAVGAFDAVLLLPAPSLIAWSTLGALAGTLEPPPVTRLAIPLPTLARRTAIAVVLAVGGAAIVRSASQVIAMALYVAAVRTGGTDHSTDHTLDLAARMDPGSYRIQLRLADAYLHGHSCVRARVHATAAHALFPSAAAPRHVMAECGGPR